MSACLSVTLVYCGQTITRIKMKLGMQVGIVPGHIVLDGDPAPPPPKGHSPPIFGPYLLRPNGWMHQDATWYGCRPQPGGLCVRWGPPSPSTISGPCLLQPNGWMDEAGTWHGGWPQPRRLCVRWGASTPPPKGDRGPLPNFGPISIVAKRLDASRCRLVGV